MSDSGFCASSTSFDYANNVLYFEKNANYGNRTCTTAGLWVERGDGLRSSISWRAVRRPRPASRPAT
jgi:hypothetical protein